MAVRIGTPPVCGGFAGEPGAVYSHPGDWRVLRPCFYALTAISHTPSPPGVADDFGSVVFGKQTHIVLRCFRKTSKQHLGGGCVIL